MGKPSVNSHANNDIYYLTLYDAQTAIYEVTRELLAFNEPIPKFYKQHIYALEAVLASPQQTFDGADLYPSMAHKAAAYFYFFIKDHPLHNGNKRIAIVATVLFLEVNGYSLTAPWQSIYNFSKQVARASKNKDEEFADVLSYMRRHVRRAGANSVYTLLQYVVDRIKSVLKIPLPLVKR